jgi:hypothetical protein
MRWLSDAASCLTFTLAGILVLLSSCLAQEVVSVDLTKVEARVDLRRPKAALEEAATGHSGTEHTTRCFDHTSKTGALETSIISLDRTYYQIGDEPKFEVTLQNIGSVPIRIPISPHLADLQPKDPAKEFGYYELQIALWIVAPDERWSTNMGGSAVLYGDDVTPIRCRVSNQANGHGSWRMEISVLTKTFVNS